MSGAIYQGRVTHSRLAPKRHVFTYNIKFFWLNLKNLAATLSPLRLIAYEKPALISYRRANYLPSNIVDHHSAVKHIITSTINPDWDGDIYMLGNLANFGYCYNPVVFYYCYSERLDYIISEIHNTPWGERHYYITDCGTANTQKLPRMHNFSSAKEFHISPFLPMDLHYDWNYSDAGQNLNIIMRNYRQDKLIFSVGMTLQKEPLTQRTINKYLVTNPFSSLSTHARIYMQAAKLYYIKRIPFYSHPDKVGK